MKGFDERARELRLLNLRVWKEGALVLSKDYDSEMRRNQYSASKSFTSTAVGIALGEGLLSLEERLVDAFPKDVPECAGENLQKATVRDLLTMGLGQGKGYLMGEQRPFLQEEDWVRYALSLPFEYAPGEKFVYNNVGPYLAGVLVQRRSGCDLVSYLTPRLFAPMGIQRPTWETDPQGFTFGAGGLFLCVTELLKFGRLLLQKGPVGRQAVGARGVFEGGRQEADRKWGAGLWVPVLAGRAGFLPGRRQVWPVCPGFPGGGRRHLHKRRAFRPAEAAGFPDGMPAPAAERGSVSMTCYAAI